jgi:ketosteroid isomerase-like protein
MGAPSPELVDLWLARAFNAQDIEAAAAMYHPDARVVRLEHVHGSNTVVEGAEEIRETMAGYVGLKPHMDVVVHHTTVAGDLALCRSQWRIMGTDQKGKPIEIHHHAMEVMRRLVQQAYQRISTGDIPLFLTLLADDVQWKVPAMANVPFAGT